MPVKYVARKCNQCAGKLEYRKESKMWKCLYCGAEVERSEQYDGLFTIKNVVRQVLLDVAYRRLDSAEKNLVECEKIDSRYIGTTIAKIAYQMMVAVTPGAYPQAELRNLFAQLKRNYEALGAVEQNVAGDEEALYEFFDNADVYATLLLVYDSLNDGVRRDYIGTLLHTGEVYAKEPNKNLLAYALKNTRYDLIDEIMKNPDNVEPSYALAELLQKYPDNDTKIKNIAGLLTSQPFPAEDKHILEGYLADSADTLATKGQIVVLGFAAGLRPGLEKIILHLLKEADSDMVKTLLHQVCRVKLNDDEVYKIVDFSATAKQAAVSITALSVLKGTNQYVMMTSKYLIALLSRRDLSGADKAAILEKMLGFTIDTKTANGVIANYLCFNNDAGEIRMLILPMLFRMVTTLPTNTVEDYILKNNQDGEDKPKVVAQIFGLDLKISFFQELLGQYLHSTVDSLAVKESIIALLTAQGLKVEPSVFTDYICYSTDAIGDKINVVKKMLQNGTKLRSDTVNTYLEQVSSDGFSAELLALTLQSASDISQRAIANYLLHCPDQDGLKAKYFIRLTEQCHQSVPTLQGDARCAGQKISGDLLSVYLLATPDTITVTKEIADFIMGNKVKLNGELTLSGMGTIKLKKFIAANQERLSPVSSQICATYKI